VIDIDDIRQAHKAIASGISRTPLVRSDTLSDIAGAELWLKLENLQYTGAFKDRGALNKLLKLTDAERRRGVIAMSAGNHAQAVAHHARRLGIAATIVMPCTAPYIKVKNTEQLGARVVLAGENLAECAAHAERLRAESGATLVHPYDDPAVIAGQGTVAIEMLEDNSGLDVLIAPVGGGGLIAGVATAAKAIKPAIEVVGVEAALYPSVRSALDGKPVVARDPTIADGIAVKDPGTLTLPIIRKLVSDVLLVEEAVLERAMALIVEIEKLVAEGAGAAPLAAVLANRARFAGRKLGLIVSGGNIDTRLLASVLMRALVRGERLIHLRIDASDAPGSLARITQIIGDEGGNIVEVRHERWFHDRPARMAVIDVLVEVRDSRGGGLIVGALGRAGISARLLGVGDAPSASMC